MGIDTIGYLSGGAAIAIAVWLVYSVNRDILERGKLRVTGEERPVGFVAVFLPYARLSARLFVFIPDDPREADRGPFGWILKYLSKFRREIQRKLRIADNPMGLTANDVMGLMLVTCVVGVCAGFIFKLQIDYAVVPVVTGLIGLFLPVIWVHDKAKKRQHKIRKALPYALDLLTLAVEAGLDFGAALHRIVGKMGDTPLSQEFGRMLKEIRLGKSRRDALRELGDRVGLEELSTVVSAMVQADELGSSLGPILRIQSEQMRMKRSQRAEKLAMEAPVKMLAPLLGCIFPTVFVIIFGPIALKYFLTR